MTPISHYAVFGQPINHSKSPRIHQLFAEQTEQVLSYDAREVSANDFQQTAQDFFEQGGLGLNCTVPLKELAWQFADKLTQRAQLAKAVNTLALQSDGTILGDNTDGIGLVTDLIKNQEMILNNKSLLVLGAGGASRGILMPLLEQSPQKIVIANRTVSKALQLASEFKQLGAIQGGSFEELAGQSFDLIINATSASLNNQLPPLPANILATNGSCYDLAYSKNPTAFVRWGQQNNAIKSLDGLGMLIEQAAESFFIWRSTRPKTQAIIALLNLERPHF